MHGKHSQVAATILQTSVKCHGSTALCHDCKIMKNPNIFQTILSFLNSRTAEEGFPGSAFPALSIYCGEMFGQNILLNYFFVFGLCACDICSRQPARVQIRDFSGFSKTLIISRLNFTDTY